MVKILFAIFFSFIFNSYSDELSLTRYNDNFCYDGDTCYAILENVPKKLKFVRIRIRGIDTPEIKGKCDKEKYDAEQAREMVGDILKDAEKITLKNMIKLKKISKKHNIPIVQHSSMRMLEHLIWIFFRCQSVAAPRCKLHQIDSERT